MTEHELKIAFAEESLRNPHDSFKAALKVTQGNSLQSLWITQNWVYDPVVLQEKKRLLEENGEEHYLPSMPSMVHDILHRAVDSKNDDYVKLLTLAANMRGMLAAKTNVNVNTTNVTQNRVMVVPVRVGSDSKPIGLDEWERQLITQQQGLIEHGS